MQQGQQGKLPRKREQALNNLLSCDTLDAAAQATGITSRTMRAWLRQPDFAAAYREARQQVLSDGIKQLQGVTSAAVDALHDALLNASSDSARVQAAKAVLEYSMRGYILETAINDIEEIRKILDGRRY
jgi:hypothetical protein